jgi:hypothetical protein
MNPYLPPGVTESMIPGNRPDDIDRERYLDDHWTDAGLFVDFLDACGFRPLLHERLQLTTDRVRSVLTVDPFGIRERWE